MRWLDDDPDVPVARERAQQPNGHDATAAATFKSGSLDQMRKIEWHWPGWLAAGKLHIIAGQKGAGKSSIVFDLLAQFTCGGKWPDGSQAPLGNVLVWSGEDNLSDTILPRIYAAGGDVNRVKFIESVTVDGVKRGFDARTDIPIVLASAHKIPDLCAVMIDPVVSVGTGDSHKNAETRRGLQPLVEFGEVRNVSIIGVTHFTKGTSDRDPIERVTGTLAYGALPRVVWAAAHGIDEDSPRRFVRVASNIGKTGGGFEYLLRQDLLPGFDFTAQRIVWGKPLSGTPKELLGDSQNQSKKLDAMQFLDSMLSGDPVPVKELQNAAKAHGISWSTVERAKKDAKNIIAEKEGKQWQWRKKAAPSYGSQI